MKTKTQNYVNDNLLTATDYAYNNAGLITSLTNKNSSGSNLSSFSYTYRADGNIASETDHNSVTTSYAYGKFYDENSEDFSDGFSSDMYAAEWISDNVSKNFILYLITPGAQFKKYQPSQSRIAIAIDPTLYANEDIGYRLYRDINAPNQND